MVVKLFPLYSTELSTRARGFGAQPKWWVVVPNLFFPLLGVIFGLYSLWETGDLSLDPQEANNFLQRGQQQPNFRSVF